MTSRNGWPNLWVTSDLMLIHDEIVALQWQQEILEDIADGDPMPNKARHASNALLKVLSFVQNVGK